MNRVFIILAMLVVACADDEPRDVDSTAPKDVIIGNQTWGAKNLDVDRFANGDIIYEAETHEKWSTATERKQPAWCYYNQEVANDRVYGKLYNWYAVADPRGLCPTGWHVPTDEEWTEMEDFLGGGEVAGKMLKSVNLWEENVNGNGTDVYGWSGVPGGIRAHHGTFDVIRRTGAWWSSSENVGNNLNVWNRYLYFNLDNVARYDLPKGTGMSVRCVKD